MSDCKMVPVEPTAEMVEAAAICVAKPDDLAAHRKQGGEV